MNESLPAFQPLLIVEVLNRFDVDYVIIGGLAATLWGSPLTTGDADVCPAGATDNLERLAAALRELDARVYSPDTPRGLRFDCQAATLAQASIWNLVTDAGRLDLTFTPSGTDGYRDLRREAVLFEINELVLPVAALADVIRSKEAAGRERDRQALPTLRRLQERLDEDSDTR